MTKFISSRARLAGLVVLLVILGCVGGPGRKAKEPTSMLWVEPAQVAQVDAALLDELAGTGVRELFVPLAHLESGEGGPLLRDSVPELPASTRLTLVVRGPLATGEAASEMATGVAASVQQMLFDVESRGLVPIGVHFDLSAGPSLEDATAFFKQLRQELDPSFFVSSSLDRSWYDDPELRSLIKAVDFVVPFLYGQRDGEEELAEAWDFAVARERLAQLEELGARYVLGWSGLGSVTHTDRQGRVKNATTQHSLAPFMWNRDLELKRGFTLEAKNRRVYTLVAQKTTRAGGWKMETQDEVRLVRPMTTDLDKLLGIVAEGQYAGLLGQLYYRLPAPAERLSITVENVLNALGEGPIVPDLTFDVQVGRRTRRGAIYRFVISNANGETTEFSLLDNNFLQIKAEPDAFGNVDVGDFYRYDLLRLAKDGKYQRMYRNANAIRLHIPILEGQQSVESGNVEIHQRNPTLELKAKFMMPDGRTVEFGPLTWKNGKFLEPVSEESVENSG